MDEEDRIARERRRIRGLIELARETGATELRVDGHVDPGLHIRLGPAPRAERAPIDPDERTELDEEEARLSKMSVEEREHYKFFRRVTRSSGAPIPAFKPRKEASQ